MGFTKEKKSKTIMIKECRNQKTSLIYVWFLMVYVRLQKHSCANVQTSEDTDLSGPVRLAKNNRLHSWRFTPVGSKRHVHVSED